MKKTLLFIFFFFYFFGNNGFSDFDIPDFKIDLQRPSYITETGTGEYLCNKEKDECKVNFKFLTLEDKDISSKNECEIISDFELPEFSDNCNPTTIIIPKNTDQNLKIKIYEKGNLENFIGKDILIKNIFEENEDEQQGGFSPLVNEDKENPNPLSGANNKVENSSTYSLIINIPDFKIDLQRPSYITETGTGEYLCNKEKDECKVNFKFLTLEDKDISSKYKCEIISDFELPEFSDNCNPTTIIIPKNTDQNLKIKIYEKGNLENFIGKDILIKNIFEKNLDGQQDGFSPLKNEENSNPLSGDNNKNENQETSSGITNIPDFKYELQSPSYVAKISENNLECDGEKDECKVNFKFLTLEGKDISSKYKCEIKTDFDLPEFSDNCNPTTIIIPKNTDQNLKIKIYEKDNSENFIEKEIFIDNTITHYLSNSKIYVQGSRSSKYRKIKMSNMECLTYEQCSVNFTATDYKLSNRYKWIFENGKKYYGYNPKSQKFSPGFYLIKLITSNDYGNRKVEHYRLRVKQLLNKTEQKLIKNNFNKIIKYKETAFLNTKEKIKLALNNKENKNNFLVKNINQSIDLINKKNKEISKNIKNISNKNLVVNIFGKVKKKKIKLVKNDINPNPLSVAKKEELEEKDKLALLKKNIKYSISFQKKNLKISGETIAKAKVKIKIGKKIFLTNSDYTGKYELKINNLVAGKYKILISSFNEKGVLVGQKYTSTKKITQKYITQLNKYKYKKYLAKIKKNQKKSRKNKIKKIKVEKINYASILPVNKEEKFSFKIFAINILITILSLIFMSFILIRKKII